MIYKLGEMVRVRKDLEVGREYGGFDFSETMSNFCGKIVEIEGAMFLADCIVYCIKQDTLKHYWTEEMLEPVIINLDNEKKLKDDFYVSNGDQIRQMSDTDLEEFIKNEFYYSSGFKPADVRKMDDHELAVQINNRCRLCEYANEYPCSGFCYYGKLLYLIREGKSNEIE